MITNSNSVRSAALRFFVGPYLRFELDLGSPRDLIEAAERLATEPDTPSEVGYLAGLPRQGVDDSIWPEVAAAAAALGFATRDRDSWANDFALLVLEAFDAGGLTPAAAASLLSAILGRADVLDQIHVFQEFIGTALALGDYPAHDKQLEQALHQIARDGLLNQS
jgi:hypothetical protein